MLNKYFSKYKARHANKLGNTALIVITPRDVLILIYLLVQVA